MAPRISNDLKERIVNWYFIDGMTMEDIHSISECSIGTVYDMIRNYRDFGEVRKLLVNVWDGHVASRMRISSFSTLFWRLIHHSTLMKCKRSLQIYAMFMFQSQQSPEP